ncbi:hypothetical protein P154DRAFT_611408 [Amniculicola lignicola CBS 123094]|uniref:Uncharacterized protein n=1 Tax=Amniculicola lignicola CBS 123094 TaxID=1392246 RepID=A0A6A5WC28_9PLEO|nr:hypothetical protein P154DRAFT_611408 [Amniculicola lignicola CBS 123094]
MEYDIIRKQPSQVESSEEGKDTAYDGFYQETEPNTHSRRHHLSPWKRVMCRSWKLQAFYCFQRQNPLRELPKVALYKGWGTTFLQLLMHSVGFGPAFFLVYLNLKSPNFSGKAFDEPILFWYKDPGNSSWLQFIASVHKDFMLASITAILYHFINNALRQTYIPLGWLFAPTHAWDASYLWSLENVGATFCMKDFSVCGKLLTTFLVLVASLLAILSGPSSATAMIPRPVTIDYPGALAVVEFPETPYVLFPSQINATYNPAKNLGMSSDSFDFKGLVSGIHVSKNPVYPTWSIPLFSTDYSTLLNVSMPYHHGKYPETVAFIPQSSIAASIRNSFAKAPNFSWDEIPRSVNNRHPLVFLARAFQPVVSVRCLMDDHFKYSPEFLSRPVFAPPLDGTEPVNIDSLSTILYYILASNASTNSSNSIEAMKWANPPLYLPYSTLGFFARVVNSDSIRNYTLSEFVRNPKAAIEDGSYLRILTCSVEATWSEAEYELQATANAPLFVTRSPKISSGRPSRRIRIDEAWARLLYEPMQWPMMYSYQHRDGLYKDWEYNEDPATLEWYIAGLFAIGLSQTHPEWHSYRNNFTCDEYADDFTEEKCINPTNLSPDYACPLNYDVSRNDCSWTNLVVRFSGFGYSTAGFWVLASVVVLIFYCVLVLVFVVDVLIRRSASTAWSSAAELLALALRSKDPQILGSISVGLESMNTFSQPVGVRVNEEEELELIFKNDDRQLDRNLRMIEVNKEY